MFQQILKLPNTSMGKKDARPSEPVEIKRRKRKQPTDGNLFIGKEESSSKSKRMKIVQVKKENGKGRSQKATKSSDWPDLNEFQVTHHASPKIWDMFERFQNFAQRRVLKRHPSGLLDSSVDETTQSKPQSDKKFDDGKNGSKAGSEQNCNNQSSEPFSVGDDDNGSSIGGDRKRRCVEISDYEDELHCAGKREPQPVSAFKPKCLNFDNLDDS